MKKLLFTLCLVVTTLFYSCSGDDNSTETDSKPIVTSTTGAITHAGVDFRHADLKVQSATIVASETLTKSTTNDIAMRLAFNDNVEVIVIAENFPTDQKININNAYDIFLKYGTKVRFNLIENNAIKATETFSVPMGSLTSSFNNDLNTLTLNFKNKYEYKGETELPEIPIIDVPEIVAPIDPNNPAELKAILQGGTWTSTDKGFFEGTAIHGSDKDYKTIELDFNRTGNNTLSYSNEKTLIEIMAISVGEKFSYSMTEPDDRFFAGFELRQNNSIVLHYTIQSITHTKIELTYEYRTDKNGYNYMRFDNKITLVRK